MKKALTIGLAVAVLTATLSWVGAGTAKRDQPANERALPVSEILNLVRTMGLNPIGDPVRRGPYYVMHAYDPRGVEVRVVADAHFGEVLSVAPVGVVANAYAPQYRRGPRIIHVPQPGDRNVRASLPNDEPEINVDDDDDVVAPPPPRRKVTKQSPARTEKAPPPKPATGPRWKPRSSEAPPPPAPPPGPKRAVLSAPPPATMGPPPQSDAKPEAGDKFRSQGDPPAAAPQAD